MRFIFTSSILISIALYLQYIDAIITRAALFIMLGLTSICGIIMIEKIKCGSEKKRDQPKYALSATAAAVT